LGGHSLLAAKVAILLRQSGANIVALDLFIHPTVESLAAKIALQREKESADAAVCLRKGGSDIPIFFTHCGNGTLLYAAALAPYIDIEIPVFGLPPRSPDAGPMQTIEAMAARMVKMIRAVQPTGPYRVAGWSFGGSLAYEIAVQLVGVDQQIDFLGLFDSYYAASNGLPHCLIRNFNETESLLNLVDLEAVQDKNLKQKISALKASAATMEFEDLVLECERTSLLPRIFHGLTGTQVKQHLACIHAANLANHHYFAQPLPAIVHFFSAKDEESPEPTPKWNTVISENVLRIVPIRGSHRSMMRNPDVEEVGRALSEAIRNSETRCIEFPEKHYSPLVTLRAGGCNPLFCVAGAGASISSFVDLVSHLDHLYPVYGFQPRGLDGTLVPHATVGAAAECYCRALEGVCQGGPVHLLGHSFGGWIAFEMAQRLLASGREIGSLTILDSRVPGHDPIREYTPSQVIMEWVGVCEQLLERPLGISLAVIESCNEAQKYQLLHARLVSEGLLPKTSVPDVLRGPLRVFAASLRAPYKPAKSYPEPLHLILATDSSLGEETNRLRAESNARDWGAFAPNLVVTQTSGSHMTMLKSPHSVVLAKLIECKLSAPTLELGSPDSGSLPLANGRCA